nr:RNA-dependent RNA polymerase [Riboviria sp.]
MEIPTFVRAWKASVDQLAYIFAHPYRKGQACTKPHRPDRSRVFSQTTWRTLLYWSTRRRGGYNVRAGRLVGTLLQLKRAFPDVSSALETEALQQHQKILSSVIPAFDQYDIVDDIIERYFPQGWATKVGVASQGRNLQPLKNGGVLGGHTARNPDGTCTIPYPAIGRTSAEPMLKKNAEDAYDRMYVCATGPDMNYNVEVRPVPDAFKVRIITRGARELKVLQPLQACLAAHMRNFPEFKYAFGPQDPAELCSDLIAMDSSRRGGKFLSIDYSAATDAVDGSFAAPLMKRIIERSGLLELQCLEKIAVRECSLGRRLLYPDGSSIFQKRGTLMGSLLSFPILCLWNASIISRALWYRRCVCDVCTIYDKGQTTEFLTNAPECSQKFREHIKETRTVPPFLVCGDDALVKCTRDAALDWKHYSTKLGLTPTPGKVFYSNRLVTFCSQYFTYAKGSGGHREWRLIEHVPVNRFLNSQADPDQYRRIPHLYRPHYKRWVRFPRREWRPLQGPRCYGGMGAPLDDNFKRSDEHFLRHANRQLVLARYAPLSVAARLAVSERNQVNVYTSWLRASLAYVEQSPHIPRVRSYRDPRKWPWQAVANTHYHQLLPHYER